MKTLFKLAAMGALAAVAVKLYRQQQLSGRPLSAGQGDGRDAGRGQDWDPENRPREQVADTNSVVTGDPQEEQRGPQPQDWRGAQNVLE